MDYQINYVLQLQYGATYLKYIYIHTYWQIEMKVNDDFLDMLMSGKGEEYLDREIERLRVEIGQQEFQEFAKDYFEKQGDQNVYANQPLTNKPAKLPQIADTQPQRSPQPQSNNPTPFLTAPTQPQNQQKNYLQQSPKSEQQQNEAQQAILQQTTNNQQDEGLTQISRQKLADGNVKITYNNGDYYEGQVSEDKKDGWGTYYYSNGEKYNGIFVDDQIHGYGRYYFLTGAEYEGDWSSGMKHGIGILKFPNNDVYEGSFCKDDFHGNGTYRYHDGGVFQGKWRFGKKNGKGQYKGADGLLQIGEWVDDKFQV